jgi:hypothetical protein
MTRTPHTTRLMRVCNRYIKMPVCLYPIMKTVVSCTFADGTEVTVTVATPSSTSALRQLVTQLAKQTGHDAELLQVYDLDDDAGECMTDTTLIEGVAKVVVIIDQRTRTCTFDKLEGGISLVVPFDLTMWVHSQKNVSDERPDMAGNIVRQLMKGIAAQTGYDPDTLSLYGSVYPDQIHGNMRVTQSKFPAITKVYRVWVKTPALEMKYLLCLKHHQEKHRRDRPHAEVDVEWVRRESHTPDYTDKDMHLRLRVCSSWAGIRFYFDERSEIETSSGKEYLKFGAVICLDRGKWKMEWMYDHLGKRVNCHTNVTLEVDELESDTV